MVQKKKAQAAFEYLLLVAAVIVIVIVVAIILRGLSAQGSTAVFSSQDKILCAGYEPSIISTTESIPDPREIVYSVLVLEGTGLTSLDHPVISFTFSNGPNRAVMLTCDNMGKCQATLEHEGNLSGVVGVGTYQSIKLLGCGGEAPTALPPPECYEDVDCELLTGPCLEAHCEGSIAYSPISGTVSCPKTCVDGACVDCTLPECQYTTQDCSATGQACEGGVCTGAACLSDGTKGDGICYTECGAHLRCASKAQGETYCEYEQFWSWTYPCCSGELLTECQDGCTGGVCDPYCGDGNCGADEHFDAASPCPQDCCDTNYDNRCTAEYDSTCHIECHGHNGCVMGQGGVGCDGCAVSSTPCKTATAYWKCCAEEIGVCPSSTPVCISGACVVTTKPELMFTASSGNPFVGPGNFAGFTVENVGSVSASGFTIQVYQKVGGSFQGRFAKSCPSLASGASVTDTTTNLLPLSTYPCVKIVIDSNFQVTEVYENNNVYQTDAC